MTNKILSFAVFFLIVFKILADKKTDEENKFPSHPALEFITSSKDILTKDRSRVLITLKKK